MPLNVNAFKMIPEVGGGRYLLEVAGRDDRYVSRVMVVGRDIGSGGIHCRCHIGHVWGLGVDLVV